MTRSVWRAGFGVYNIHTHTHSSIHMVHHLLHYRQLMTMRLLVHRGHTPQMQQQRPIGFERECDRFICVLLECHDRATERQSALERRTARWERVQSLEICAPWTWTHKSALCINIAICKVYEDNAALHLAAAAAACYAMPDHMHVKLNGTHNHTPISYRGELAQQQRDCAHSS